MGNTSNYRIKYKMRGKEKVGIRRSIKKIINMRKGV